MEIKTDYLELVYCTIHQNKLFFICLSGDEIADRIFTMRAINEYFDSFEKTSIFQGKESLFP